MKENHPLRGRRIVITRNSESAGRMGRELEQLGADVLEIPLIRIAPDLDTDVAKDVFREFASYEWLVFTSRNGVRHFFEPFLKAFSDIRSLGFIRIAAIGPGTAEALGEYFLRADLLPQTAVAEDLAAALKEEQTLDNLKILIITGNRNRDVLSRVLTEAGAIVDTLRAYRTETVDLSENVAAARFRKEGADALVFASSSAVKAFGEQSQHLQLGKGAKVPALCSFGPITTQTMQAAGIPVNVEAAESTIPAMADALIHFFRQQS